MLSETKYNPQNPTKFIVLDPHGADFSNFLNLHPEILKHEEVQRDIDLFKRYLSIERDLGATDLAHSLAQKIAISSGSGVEVLSIEYPRGLLDGGRDEHFAVRCALPKSLLQKYSSQWIALHLETIKRIENKIVASDQDCLVIDVHTMSKYDFLRFVDGKPISESVSWENLGDYVKAFTEARETTRPFNILCRDESHQYTSCPKIVKRLKDQLAAEAVTFEEDVPYRIMKRYRSYTYLNIRRGVAIDLPKTFVTKEQETYNLAHLEVDQEKVNYWGQLLASAFT